MGSARDPGSGSSIERELREVNEALLVSSIHQHELTEQAQHAEAALRKSEAELRLRAEELARFNRLTVGRELRIIELKREINGLAQQLGQPPRYSLELERTVSDGAAELPSQEDDAEPAVRASGDIVPLASVLRTEEVARRPSRPPDYATEIDALVSLMRALADSPGDVLQLLAQKILEVLHADSAGLSLLTSDAKRFYWPAIAGLWEPYIGGGTPRDFGPCGDVLDCNAPLLFGRLEGRYAYFRPVTPAVEEALLVPFYVEGKAVGTLWAVSHGDRRFDAEDLRQLQNLGRFASAAHQTNEVRTLEESRRAAALNLMEDMVRLEQKTQEQAQSLADLNRRKDEFLAMLSHELRNPLASIQNAAHLLRLQRDRNSIQAKAHEMIERQVSQLARLVDDLLEVSRISTGRVRLHMESVDLRRTIEHACETIRPHVEQKAQSLTKSLPAEPMWVSGDPVRMEQIAVNLLNNASKYTDREGRISVLLQREGDEAVLRVRDNGVGIAPQMLPRIFDLFTQADRSLDRAQGGLGIGLALVQSLVTMHRGRVEAFSTLGHGSEFVVRLPVPLSLDESAAIAEEKGSAPTHVLKVLVVDDNVDAAQSIGMLLEMLGHTIRLAHDGASALKCAREFVPDVVLLDIGLPVADGFQVARCLREIPTLSNVLLVALTGYGQDADKQRAQEAGFDHHLVKPVDFAKVESILSAASNRLS